MNTVRIIHDNQEKTSEDLFNNNHLLLSNILLTHGLKQLCARNLQKIFYLHKNS